MLPAGLKIKEIKTTWEAYPDPGISLDQLVGIMKLLKNQVLRIDRQKGCLVIAETEIKEAPGAIR